MNPDSADDLRTQLRDFADCVRRYREKVKASKPGPHLKYREELSTLAGCVDAWVSYLLVDEATAIADAKGDAK